MGRACHYQDGKERGHVLTGMVGGHAITRLVRGGGHVITRMVVRGEHVITRLGGGMSLPEWWGEWTCHYQDGG